jgi:hypothetical protein
VPTTSPSSKDRRRAVGQRVVRPSQAAIPPSPTAPSPAAVSSAAVSSAAAFPAAASPPPAPGRAPTPDEVDAITTAVFSSPLVAWLPPRQLRIVGIRISTGSPDWAFAALCPDGVDPAVIVLRWDMALGWVLDQVGTAGVGAGLAPAGVLMEFGR